MNKIFGWIALLALLVTTFCYNNALALKLAHFSSIAYENAANINAWNCGQCGSYPLASPKVFSNTTGNIQGFTGFSSSLNAIVVSFRGTSDIKNWIIDLTTTQTVYAKCSGCAVHKGFFDGYNMIKPQMVSQLQALRATYRNAPILVTGHSMGGAFAILAAADIKDLYGNVQSVYTFGQPRVGNAQFASYYTGHISETYRVIHYGDLVPHVPPSALTFVHGSHEIWYE
jgi:predicted lipase